MQPNSQKEHQMLVVAHVIENEIFVTFLGLEVIPGLGNIFLGILGKGVHVCNNLTTTKKIELLRLQLEANAKGLFSSRNVTSQDDASKPCLHHQCLGV